MDWQQLKESQQLNEIDHRSSEIPVLIYKHSSRCSICFAAKEQIEKNWRSETSEKLRPYFLDVIEQQELAREVASRYKITHESPQVLVISNGNCIYSASHFEIKLSEVLDSVSEESN